MSEMIERVARAIYFSQTGGKAEGNAGVEYLELNGYMDDAREVLEAMREPTAFMVSAGSAAEVETSEILEFQEIGYGASRKCWQNMIDSALTHSPLTTPLNGA